jgi:acyl dehydratase
MAMAEKLLLEDLRVGPRFTSAPRRITADAINAFAAYYHPQRFHLDDDAAHATLFVGVTMRLIVESVALSSGIIGSGGGLTWPLPTRPGDRMAPPRSHRERGMVEVRCVTINKNGAVVQTFTLKLVVARAPNV